MARNTKREGNKDKYDKIYEYLQGERDSDELNPKYVSLAENVKKAYPLLCQLKPLHKIVKDISLACNITERHAQNIIQAVRKIYGKVAAESREGLKAIRIQQTLSLIEEIKDDKILKPKDKYTLLDKLMDKLNKLEGLYEDQNTLINVYNTLQLPDLFLTDDSEAVNYDYIEIEEIKDNAKS